MKEPIYAMTLLISGDSLAGRAVVTISVSRGKQSQREISRWVFDSILTTQSVDEVMSVVHAVAWAGIEDTCALQDELPYPPE